MGEREDAEPFLERYGWNATVGQTRAEGFRFFVVAEGAVAYVDTGAAWVVAGAPLAAEAALGEVAERFLRAARGAGRRVGFFGVEPRFLRAVPLRAVHVAEQPEWDPSAWPATLAAHRRLREQLRRARAKGVRVRALSAGALEGERGLVERLRRVRADWLDSRGMPAMGFLAAVPEVEARGARTWLLAERHGELVAAATLLPVPARRGTLVEHVFREPSAPNGTLELVLDAAMRGAIPAGGAWLTLGMVALAGSVPSLLRIARRVGEFLYGFEGIRSARARLHPARWTPLYLAYPHDQSTVMTFYDLLTAFARGSLLRFGLRTLGHRFRRWLVRRRPGNAPSVDVARENRGDHA